MGSKSKVSHEDFSVAKLRVKIPSSFPLSFLKKGSLLQVITQSNSYEHVAEAGMGCSGPGEQDRKEMWDLRWC